MNKEINIELIEACLSKNGKAQRELYDLLLPYLELMGKRYLRNDSDLKDALQDTFVKMFKALAQFDIKKAGFKTWVTRILINTCLKYNAKSERNATSELIADLHDPIFTSSVIDQMTIDDLLIWLRKMPFPYYQVFNLYVIDGFSHDEISELLSIEPSSSRTRLSRARGWLKKRLKNYNSFVLSL